MKIWRVTLIAYVVVMTSCFVIDMWINPSVLVSYWHVVGAAFSGAPIVCR